MRYSLVPALTASVFTVLTSATFQLPTGCTHQDEWGQAIVQNHCSDPVYFILDNEPHTVSIAAGDEVSVPIYEKDADKGGMSIKLFKDKDTDIWSVPAITQFEITAAADQQYYDISNVNSNIGNGKNGNGEDCDKEPPFMNDGMKVIAAGKETLCEAGQNPCNKAYSNNKDDWATTSTGLGNDITLTICPGGKSSGKQQGGGDDNKQQGKTDKAEKKAELKDVKQDKKQDPPTPTPPPTLPKNKEDQDNDDDDEEVETVMVTKVVTGPAVSVTNFFDQNGKQIHDQKEKRHEHVHQHVHNKIHRRRLNL